MVRLSLLLVHQKNALVFVLRFDSHHQARQEAELPTTGDRDGDCLLPQVLHQERVL